MSLSCTFSAIVGILACYTNMVNMENIIPDKRQHVGIIIVSMLTW